jgi:polyisoprenoid-binding protein YceI
MKKIIIIIIAGFLPLLISAQKYTTKTGNISFYSYAPLENITAVNDQVNAALDISTGEFVVKALIKSFEFPKSLMQEHFNEDYLESDTYPNASFVGKVANIANFDFTKNGPVAVMVSGDLTIHGITKKIDANGTFEIKDGAISGYSKFTITLSDYNITIPSTVVNNISKTIDITVNLILNKLVK